MRFLLPAAAAVAAAVGIGYSVDAYHALQTREARDQQVILVNHAYADALYAAGKRRDEAEAGAAAHYRQDVDAATRVYKSALARAEGAPLTADSSPTTPPGRSPL